MKLVLDTNILLDHFLEREPFCDSATLVMDLGYVGEFELWISTSQITDLIYVLTEGGKPKLAAYAKETMRHLRKFVHLYAIDDSDYDAVARSTWTDLEDAFIYQAAQDIKADVILSRDKEGFTKSGIQILTCEELFETLEKDFGLVYSSELLK